ncbi:MAG: biotin synthase BioB [Candidatus Omnitrophica bacterium]|nr:biotin synthase BioB [Candidatus Omnitrophota bacterium]
MQSVDWVGRQALDGKLLSRDSYLGLLRLENPSEISRLFEFAVAVTRKFQGRRAGLCSIVNAKSGLCAEDCAFCAQSVRYKTGIPRYPLLEIAAVLEKAKQAEDRGCDEFCIVTSGGKLTDAEFGKLLEIIAAVRRAVTLHLDASVGFLDFVRARRLKEAGIRRINHNIQTSSSFYERIATTHSFEDRVATLGAARAAGLELCCGVLLGMGETREDRVDAAFEIRTYAPECVPINLLDPRPGTPLENQPLLDPIEVLKTVAVFRLILPGSPLRLAGGRRLQLGGWQREALRAGVNGLIVGDLLTTPGNALESDFEDLRAEGFEFGR